MLGFLSRNLRELKLQLSKRISKFVDTELGEFRSDPRWLFQEECPYTSDTGRSSGDSQQIYIVRDNAHSDIVVNNSLDDSESDYTDIGFPRSHDLYGAASSGGGCCPPVVDQYTWLALIAGIALATYFLRIAVTTNIMGRKRRKREGNFLMIGEKD